MFLDQSIIEIDMYIAGLEGVWFQEREYFKICCARSSQKVTTGIKFQ